MTWQDFAKDLIMDPSLEWALALVTQRSEIIPIFLLIGILIVVIGALYFLYANRRVNDTLNRNSVLIFSGWTLALIALIIGIAMWCIYIKSFDIFVSSLYGDKIQKISQLSFGQNTQILEYLRNLIFLEFSLLIPTIVWLVMLIMDKFETPGFSIRCLHCDPITVNRVVADKNLYYCLNGDKYEEVKINETISKIASRIIYVYHAKDGIYLTNSKSDPDNRSKVGVIHYNRLKKKLRLIVSGKVIAQVSNKDVFLLTGNESTSPFITMDNPKENSQNIGIKVQFSIDDHKKKRWGELGICLISIVFLTLVVLFLHDAGKIVFANSDNRSGLEFVQICPQNFKIDYVGPSEDDQEPDSSKPLHVRGVVHFPEVEGASKHNEPDLRLSLPDGKNIRIDDTGWFPLMPLEVRFLFDIEQKIVYDQSIENPLKPDIKDGLTKEEKFWDALEDALVLSFRFNGVWPNSDTGRVYSRYSCDNFSPLTDLYLDMTIESDKDSKLVDRLRMENSVRNALRLGQKCAYKKPGDPFTGKYEDIHNKLLPQKKNEGSDPYPVLVILRWKDSQVLTEETEVDQERGTVIIVNLGRERVYKHYTVNHHHVFDLASPVISRENDVSAFYHEFSKVISEIRNNSNSLYFDARLPKIFDIYASKATFLKLGYKGCDNKVSNSLWSYWTNHDHSGARRQYLDYIIMFLCLIVLMIDVLVFCIATYIFVY